ncbi:response regulator transcription factor [Tengunoibacter tsumagoiensis]|uniref:DNA-binding response regulator n=1 Tax=Tengunoibacter tsumagoiensis TaxID=2014871 RepID=A0A402A914_9CHLR|nr:response regulator [Tengunoibacter tsumagoiensis]GCE15486.1 DNA-binding response regulator [Tengunoibacter tsumagoiensis]
MFKVLLVDDEDLDLHGMEQFVPWSCYRMEVLAAVKSGYEALQVIKQHHIDLLVTDIRMPGMSGLELARQIRTLQPSLKIIFVSGYQDFQYARQAITLHANGYVLKPIDDDELFQEISNVSIQLQEELKRTRLQSPRPSHPTATEQRSQTPSRTSLLDQPGLKRNQKLIKEIDQYIQTHLGENILLHEVAFHFGFSPNYFGRLFKEEIGASFTDYVIRKKLEEAAHLLCNSRLKLYEIAQRLGYSSLTYFGRQFKEAYGQTPGDFRRQC